jgi:hypothetical protein
LTDIVAMRAILMYMLLSLPMFAPGQTMWCDVDSRFTLNDRNLQYRHFKSLVEKWKANSSYHNRSVVYMPVVIHVVADEPYVPVSEAQVLQQLDVINADFAGAGDNVPKLTDEFLPLVADAQIRFCLAKTDPQGQPTTGITFTRTDVNDIALQTGQGGRIAIHYDQLGGKTGWDPSRYINIWVGEYGDILGSASFPGMASFPEEIGLVIDIRHFGSIGDAGGTGFYNGGHTLTHEMGHFLGLKHIWGQGFETTCDDSDDIDDTPNASGPYFDCPSGVQMSCGTSNMYQNFMDFTDDRCLSAFTPGQVLMMQAVQQLFYPALTLEGGCQAYAEAYPQWYHDLVWSFDKSSATYVIYNTDGWMARKNIFVYSADGKLVHQGQWDQEWSYLLDLNKVSAGVYFVIMESGGDDFVRKIIIY